MSKNLGKKRGISWLLICLLIGTLCLAGCGGGGNQEKPTASEEFVIGCVGAMTGQSAQLGRNLKEGVTIAAEEINANGGINGMKVRLVIRDDEADPTKSLNLTRELVTKEKINAFIGPTNTTCAKAIQPYLNQNKVIQMNGGCTGAALVNPEEFPYSFRVHIPDPGQAEFMVKNAIEKGYKRIAMVHDTSALGTMAKEGMESVLAGAGMKPVCDASYNVGDVDMLPVAQKLKNANPEICLFFTLGVDGARVVKAMEKLDFLPPKTVIHGYTGMTMPVFMELAGPASKGIVGNAPFNSTWSDKDKGNPKVLNIAEKVQGKGDVILGTVLSFYDCVYLLKEGVEKADSLDAEKIKAGLESIKDFDGAYCLASYGPDDHEAAGAEMMAVCDVNITNEFGMFKRIEE